MAKKRFTEEQIVGILKEAQTGIRTEDLCRKYNVSTNTIYNWRQKYAGMEVSDVRRLRCLEGGASENGKNRTLRIGQRS